MANAELIALTKTSRKSHRKPAPKIYQLNRPSNWDLLNAKNRLSIRRLRKNLWEITYLCWNLTKGEKLQERVNQ